MSKPGLWALVLHKYHVAPERIKMSKIRKMSESSFKDNWGLSPRQSFRLCVNDERGKTAAHQLCELIAMLSTYNPDRPCPIPIKIPETTWPPVPELLAQPAQTLTNRPIAIKTSVFIVNPPSAFPASSSNAASSSRTTASWNFPRQGTADERRRDQTAHQD